MENEHEFDDHSHLEGYDEPELEEVPEPEKEEPIERNRCPEGGELGTDYLLYSLCRGCKNEKQCKKYHDREARGLKETKGALPLRLQIPIGLMVDDLDSIDRCILSLVFFRYQGANDGISWDKNITFAKLAGCNKSTITRRLDNGHRSLITKGYLSSVLKCRRRGKKQPKKGEKVEYRTSRELRLTVKTLRLINRYRETKDKL